MQLVPTDTITAVASAPGGARRGLIRMSGPRAIKILLGCVTESEIRQRLGRLRVPTVIAANLELGGGQVLPCELFVWPNERSYTRQVVVEVHTIGSPSLLDAALRALCAAGARLAAPGEFTLRAFLSGRLDLAQAEAVLGVIDAQDRRALDVALAQLAGGLSRPLGDLRDALVDLLADLEAGLDFVDEDIEFVSANEVASRLATAVAAAADVLGLLGMRTHRRDAFRVVLVGAPNAGKSSLFNALAGSSAIVSAVAGTTRDALTAQVDFGGIRCELTDTAGLDDRHTDASLSSIDAFAQSQSRAKLAQADLELWCFDATQPFAAAQLPPSATPRIVVATKIDATKNGSREAADSRLPTPEFLATSSVTGEGLDRLRAAIVAAAHDSLNAESSVVASTAIRSQESLRLAVSAIEEARQLAASRSGDELIAAEIRLALAELGKIVGVVYTDDILDRLFGRFCIGK